MHLKHHLFKHFTFFIDFKPAINNEDIFDINSIWYTEVKFEASEIKKKTTMYEISELWLNLLI